MASSDELRCNHVSCRKRLHIQACVTSCSHVFCVDCSNKSFRSALICPTCDTALTEPRDISLTDLNPSEEYKSTLLAGLRPDLILDIARRALSFWGYQKSQEMSYQEIMLKEVNDKYSDLERQISMIRNVANHEIQGLRDKIASMQDDHAAEKRRNIELSELYAEKTRNYQKLQQMFDQIKRRSLQQQPPAKSTSINFQTVVNHPRGHAGNGNSNGGEGGPTHHRDLRGREGSVAAGNGGGGIFELSGSQRQQQRQQNISRPWIERVPNNARGVRAAVGGIMGHGVSGGGSEYGDGGGGLGGGRSFTKNFFA